MPHTTRLDLHAHPLSRACWLETSLGGGRPAAAAARQSQRLALECYGQKKIGERWKELSPVHHVRRGLPPTIIFHGTGDTVTPFAGAKAFHEAMLAAGNRCTLEVHPGGRHGYLMFDRKLYRATLTRTEAFLKSLNMLPLAKVR